MVVFKILGNLNEYFNLNVDALATLSAISGAAFAQSSVTISGRLDMGLTSMTTKNTNFDGVAATDSKVSDFTGAQNTRTTSRLTFSGKEDLGGGLKAGFSIEQGLNPSDDSSLFAGSTRDGNISLSGGFGSVVVGTISSNSMDAVRGFSAGTVGIAGGDFLARQATGANFRAHVQASAGMTAAQVATELELTDAEYAALGAGIAGRSRNVLAYSNAIGDFSYSIGTTQQKNVTAGTKTNAYLLGAAYVSGPLTIKAAYADGKATATAAGDASNAKQKDQSIGASYNFGFVVPYVVYESAKGSMAGDDGVQALQLKSSGYELGAKFPMGSLTPYILVTSGKNTLNLTGLGDVLQSKESGYQLGATYDMSKRTYFYASMGQDKTKGRTAGDATVSKRTGYAAGIVHQF